MRLDGHIYQRSNLLGIQALSADTVLCGAIDFIVRNSFLDVVHIEISRELPPPHQGRLVVSRVDAEELWMFLEYRFPAIRTLARSTDPPPPRR